ncbi:MAG: DUF4105 domain-containing protein [Sporocytophaga sp.]|uniref:lipoprotein N-acyltransferase Lnb domain-containing protein n=1 Tax=Sporocytophaga sp. TaxID=2231183 RepID=UPI001B1EA697|nr:DUF4105 domain-containing protein [Sporocytophaga sp.]MBO9698781.1 DUF4105 domain-containing protein [Sporocytophaga sp.]
MKKFWLLLFSALLPFISFSLPKLSPHAKVSLITVAPGQELYSSFGHSAIWIKDDSNYIDKVYNYGTFDFETPGFYSKFVRGKLLYMLSVSRSDYMFYGAEQEQRSVIEQQLNMTLSQKQKLYNFLETNYLPENRYYKYDFFYDNCSSRLRDAFKTALGDSLQFKNIVFKDQSFRQLIDPYLVNKQFQDLGMDLGLGAPADRIATPSQYMFLPDHLMNAIGNATVLSDSGKMAFVAKNNILFKANPPKDHGAPVTPAMVFAALLLIGGFSTFVTWKKRPEAFTMDGILFLILGLFGLLLLFLWFGTDHKVTVHNWNIIWAFPTHLIAAVLLFKKKRSVTTGYYFLLNGIVVLIFTACISVLPQEINMAIIPFLLLIILRSFTLYYKITKRRNFYPL